MLDLISTYRIQFHKNFNFRRLEEILPYLQKLGIKTIYASPIFEASPGSTHGYDIVNPHRINPEIGTEEEFRQLQDRLKKAGMHWLQDIVPNHMAFAPQNLWLMDVLEKGPQSAYAPFFDIVFNDEFYQGKLMVPFLGSSLEDVLEKAELKVVYQNKRFSLQYYDNFYPLHPRSYIRILSQQEAPSAAIRQLQEEIRLLLREEESLKLAEQWHELLIQLQGLQHADESQVYVQECLRLINADKTELKALLDEQAYRLCHWQETEKSINYRRFFTVNGLICLNMQHPDVFVHYHQYIFQLLKSGLSQGLRIDHVDGLFDPTKYLQDMRTEVGPEVYLTVEKILEPGEELPQHWPVQGTTGYDFLALLNNLFTYSGQETLFTHFYQELTADARSLHEHIREKKAFILHQRMAGELNNLLTLFLELELAGPDERARISHADIKAALAEFLIQCPVYRYYGNQFPLSDDEAGQLTALFNRLRKQRKDILAAIDLLSAVFLQYPLLHDTDYRQRALRFYQRCMQFTGPLMAKGVEDTLMYSYNRFIGHNEVGDSPESFGISIDDFHQKMLERQRNWPLAGSTTSTHDTKRGEDVRARLNVLSELTEEWLEIFAEWQLSNQALKENGMPDARDEYLIYQTLVGAYPTAQSGADHFPERLQEYLQKAVREAKVHSNWSQPNVEYEAAVKAFTDSILDQSRPFWLSFQAFQQKIVDYGILNSLAQLLLKFCCPGLPDVYQGTELWDLSLVDPDNRRAVDYGQRQLWLEEILEAKKQNPETFIEGLWDERYSGKIKLWLSHCLLQERQMNAKLFTEGFYVPLQVEGRYKEHVLAFARRYGSEWLIAVIPLHLLTLCKQQQCEWNQLNWKDTRIILPEEAPLEWQHALIKLKSKTEDNGIALAELFSDFPLALLKSEPASHERRAGILMHITSLPADFGLGDFGPVAYRFAEFLSRSRQTFWQLLPLNPTEAGSRHSPYSSHSSMAGNPLLISPELLVEEGLLKEEEIKPYRLTPHEKAEFDKAEENKRLLFDKAYSRFLQTDFPELKTAFQEFCRKENYWLQDFALYMVLKEKMEDKPWYAWPEPYKQRENSVLQEVTERESKVLDKVKWLQFIFSRQWNALRNYCHRLGIQLFGDLPFYVSYDSVDVWAHPQIFSLDAEGRMEGVAGVPPDYFNDKGQLWGMPVFRWDVLKAQNYQWWIQRIQKNMERFDLLRLDHFRAFADYWEVPAGEETAINGSWKEGPGADFFHALKKALGELPFVAEDLGDINQAVYDLRDQFKLPGMKVLHFAFGDDMPDSPYIPHNYTPNHLVYTGTHDNNTTRGWFRQDMQKVDRKRLEEYLAAAPLDQEIHLQLARLAYASVAKIVILPIQDVLGMDESARMNMPASTEHNWLWRMPANHLGAKHEARLRNWVWLYKRA